MDGAYRSQNLPRHFVGAAEKSAADMIGRIEHGTDIFGLTAGQFSFIDVLEHVVNCIGPAHLVIATWTAAGASIRKVEKMLTRKDILSMRWIVDRSFRTRQPELCTLLDKTFGPETVRTTRSHAKFMLAYNDQFAVTLRTSMNLNQNPRIEDFTITESRALCDYILGLVAVMFECQAPTDNYSNRQNELEKLILPETGMVEEKREPLCLPIAPLILNV